jgi:dipeptidase D
MVGIREWIFTKVGNANKIMNRLLFDGLIILDYKFSYYRRKPRNAIPRESVKVIIASVFDEAFVYDMQQVVNDIKQN